MENNFYVDKDLTIQGTKSLTDTLKNEELELLNRIEFHRLKGEWGTYKNLVQALSQVVELRNKEEGKELLELREIAKMSTCINSEEIGLALKSLLENEVSKRYANMKAVIKEEIKEENYQNMLRYSPL